MAPSETVCSCKVGTVASEWGLEQMHEELETRWGKEGASVRTLTEEFNRRVLHAGFEQSGRTPIDGEIDNLYRVLTGEDVDAGSRTQVRERLRRNGIPIEEIEGQFVSHQTLYRHLRNCLSAAHDGEEKTQAELIDTWRDRIRALETRTSNVTDRGVGQLADAGAVDIGDFDVLVDVNVICNDCGEFYELEAFLDGRSCGCRETEL